jgi:diguanylate cyclase (GGDEF)-like protein
VPASSTSPTGSDDFTGTTGASSAPAVATVTPASTSTSSSTTSGTSSLPTILKTQLPKFSFTSPTALKRLSQGKQSGATTGTSATGGTAGTTATGGAPAGGGTGGATHTGTGAAGARGGTSTHHHGTRSTAQSSLPSPINASVRVIDHFVNVIPTAVWIALGAAFALAAAFGAAALRSSRRARRREREFAAISAAALTDALTGILNRRGFMEAAERELARASRYDRPFVLAYVDVRGLKAVNDSEGHLMGDELIKTVAGLMKESARADDVVGRIGGDEFALLLAEQTTEGAEPVIRRIRARVAERRAEMEITMPWELTIGLASFDHDGTTLDELLHVADRRLYEQRGIALR